VFHEDAALTKHLDVISPLLAVDGVLSLAKVKTHNFMTFTGAVKNLFGVIPGYSKPGYHAKLADRERFADMLLDIATFVKPRVTIMDGVVGLEGDGPGTAGAPRELGFLLAARDPVWLDAACCDLVAIDPATVPVLVRAVARGLWPGPSVPIPWVGESPDGLRIDDFAKPTLAADTAGFGVGPGVEGPVRRAVRGLFTARPRPQRDRCTGCRTCARACPVEAIAIRDRLAVVDDDACIRCYCCHELCPEAAIDLVVGRSGRAMRRLGVR
jgi:Pyruvate/2-oxoacid:ferredoxin oxidoreductase delta subunit